MDSASARMGSKANIAIDVLAIISISVTRVVGKFFKMKIDLNFYVLIIFLYFLKTLWL